MINFNLFGFRAALMTVQQEKYIALANAKSGGPQAMLDDRERARIRHFMEYVAKKADQLGLPTVRNRIELIFDKLRLDAAVSFVEMANDMSIIQEAFDEDTYFLYLYAYPSEKVKSVLLFEHEWDAALAAFPDIKDDAEGAVDLYALGHNLACVFHLMRVMEIGVQRFGKKLGVSLTRKTAQRLTDLTWYQILDQLNPKLKALPRKTAAAKARHEKYSAVHSYLYRVKDAWKNPTMHPRAKGYSELETLNLINYVQSFMNELGSVVSRKQP